jgi:RHS repeat-associated protein
MYARDASINSGALSQTEMSMYGSSRLGVWNINRSVANIDTVNYYNFSNHFARGNKLFELGNHLGNVLVTISDKKIGVDEAYTLSCATCPLVLTGTTNGIIDYYKPDVMTANDYYPFGMAMPGRKYSAGSGYRYGFNGKENDNEVKGDGNQQDYGMRIYDTRIARFLSEDPITKLYPELTPFQFASNRPIQGIDLDGLEFFSMNPNTPGGMTMKAIAVTSENVAKKWNNSRAGKFTDGVLNTGFGIAATIASIEYIGATGGIGATLGGATALTLSLGEVGIGFAQMTDALSGSNNNTEALHNSSNLPGLVAYGTGSKYAPFIDGVGGLGSTFSTSKSVKALFKDRLGLASAYTAFTQSTTLLNTLGLIDQSIDVAVFMVESVKLFNNFGNGSDSKILKSQTLNYTLSITAVDGDNLTKIAKKFKTDVKTLSKQNNISNPDDIKVGQKITYSKTITSKVR